MPNHPDDDPPLNFGPPPAEFDYAKYWDNKLREGDMDDDPPPALSQRLVAPTPTQAAAMEARNQIALGPWVVTPDWVRYHGIELDLTPKQRMILLHLARRYPHQVSSTELNQYAVSPYYGMPASNTIPMHVKELIKRLARRNIVAPISSHPGRSGGYTWNHNQ